MSNKKSFIISLAILVFSSGAALAHNGHNHTETKAEKKTEPAKAGTTKAVLKLFKMDCSACSAQIEAKLNSLDGISEAVADYDKAEAYVIYNPTKINVNKMIAEIKAIEFDAKAGDIKTFPAEGLKTVKDTKTSQKIASLKAIEEDDAKVGIKIVSNGEVIDLEKNLDKNKLTVYDFYADWCDHCIELGENLKILMKKNPEAFVVKKIHLKGEAADTYKLPIVKKYLKDVFGFPYIRVYNSKGILLYEGGDLKEIEQVLSKNSGKA
jgi:thiol-disulfide isomerase/thioredoxin